MTVKMCCVYAHPEPRCADVYSHITQGDKIYIIENMHKSKEESGKNSWLIQPTYLGKWKRRIRSDADTDTDADADTDADTDTDQN